MAAGMSLFNDLCRKPAAARVDGIAEKAQHEIGETVHMDITSDTDHLPVRTIAARAAIFFGYLLGFMASMAVIGLIPTAGLFVILFMRIEGRERWNLVLTYAACVVLFIYVVFDRFMSIPWPQTLLGHIVPALKIIPSV
jgi:hypothetical protein